MSKAKDAISGQSSQPTMWHPDLFTAWALSCNADLKAVRQARAAYQQAYQRQEHAHLHTTRTNDQSVVETAADNVPKGRRPRR